MFCYSEITFTLIFVSIFGFGQSQSPNWVRIAGKNYTVVQDFEATWFDAADRCLMMGGHLLTFDNEDQRSVIVEELMKLNFEGRFWISSYSLAFGKKQFSNRGRGTNMTFAFWDKGEPNNFMFHEDCVEIHYSTRVHPPTYKMNDNRCIRTYGYICEQIFPFFGIC